MVRHVAMILPVGLMLASQQYAPESLENHMLSVGSFIGGVIAVLGFLWWAHKDRQSVEVRLAVFDERMNKLTEQIETVVCTVADQQAEMQRALLAMLESKKKS